MVRLQQYDSKLYGNLFIDSLNSTMVRLQRPIPDSATGTMYICLNSTMVRLQQYDSKLYGNLFIDSLNSTMVRLQQVNLNILTSQSLGSQFHYGSITTRLLGNCRRCYRLVSIPLWFDYN